MQKLNVAIIGQGRSGKGIHGVYLRSEANKYFNVRYVVDMDENSRKVAQQLYPGCKTFADYHELLSLSDIDLVANVSYSYMHYEITKDLLEHNKNVLVDKPFARNRYECDTLIKLAKERNLLLAVFQQSFYAPFYAFILDTIKKGTLGKIEQFSIKYSGFSRRWDWQTLQKKLGGNAYNTGPHPFGLALGFLGFDKDAKVLFSRLDHTDMSSGDADDYVKVLLSAPGKPLVDVEINNTDAFSDYNVKIQGTKGTLKTDIDRYRLKYIVDGENVARPVVEGTLRNEEGAPIYCGEKLVAHEEEGKYDGNPFDVGTAKLYEDVYFALTKGRKMFITAENAAQIISVIEEIHAANPLPIKF